MKISLLPAFEDNYIFMLEGRGEVAVVDPGDATPVVDYLKNNNLALTHILITHHHADHIGGVKQLAAHFKNLKIWGHSKETRVPFLNMTLDENQSFVVCGRTVRLRATPGHTLGHCVYEFAPTSERPIDIFCGDALFGAGCGGLMGGTMEQLYQSTNLFKSYPDNSQIWCAHEYTQKNLEIALKLESTNGAISERLTKVIGNSRKGNPTIPLTLKDELETNPFLRVDKKTIKDSTDTKTDFETFAAVRKFRDLF